MIGIQAQDIHCFNSSRSQERTQTCLLRKLKHATSVMTVNILSPIFSIAMETIFERIPEHVTATPRPPTTLH